MVKYDWNCRTVDAYVKKEEESDVVYNVHWIVTGFSDELNPDGNPYSSRSIGTQTLNTSEITNFIPFDQVTNEEIVAWTKSSMSEEQVKNIETGISTQIESIIHPLTVTLTIK